MVVVLPDVIPTPTLFVDFCWKSDSAEFCQNPQFVESTQVLKQSSKVHLGCTNLITHNSLLNGHNMKLSFNVYNNCFMKVLLESCLTMHFIVVVCNVSVSILPS